MNSIGKLKTESPAIKRIPSPAYVDLTVKCHSGALKVPINFMPGGNSHWKWYCTIQ